MQPGRSAHDLLANLTRRVARFAIRVFAAGLAGLLFGCGSERDPEEKNFLFRASAETVKPFVWFYADLDNTEAGFQAQLDFGDPFRTTTLLMQDWLARRDAGVASARADKMIAKWRLDEPGGRLDYRFDYRGLAAGWWSGMDSWSFPMLLLSLWQDTGNTRYKQIADRLIATASSGVAEGGVVWRDGAQCWFSSYVWSTMLPADEWYVLNSHLYSLAATRLVADATRDPALDALYRCGLEATKSLAARFAIGTQWLRYMLQPSTINQTHYLIFETMLLDALSRLDPDPFFVDQSALRRALLQRYFPVQVRETAAGRRLSMSTLGAPHPYLIDTYALSLHCRDGRIEERHAIDDPSNAAVPLVERVFLDAPTMLDPATATCRVEARNAGRKHLFYEAPVVATAQHGGAGEPIAARFEAGLDAQLVDATTALIDPSRRVTLPGEPPSYLDTQGRLVLTPVVPVDWASEELLGIEFGADGALAIAVTVVSEGVEYFRYYPRTAAAPKTVVLLSPVGFDGGDAIRNVERVTVFVYTEHSTTPVTVREPRLLKFADQIALRAYFASERAVFTTE